MSEYAIKRQPVLVDAPSGDDMLRIYDVSAGSEGRVTLQEIADFVVIGGNLETDYSNSIATMIAAVGSTPTRVVVGANTSVPASAVVPKNVTLEIKEGAQITIAAAQALTLNGPIEAGYYQIFAGDGTTALTGDARPEWWGVTGDGVTVDSTAMQKCLDGVTSGTIHLRAVTYLMEALTPPSNVNWEFQPGTTIQGNSLTAGGHILLFEEKSNVVINGNGGRINGKTGTNERLNLTFLGCTNIHVKNLRSDNGFDGFYIGPATDGTPAFCTGIMITGCEATGNDRGAMTVISAKDCVIDNCRFDGSNGFNPGFGIDVEPDSDTDIIQGVVVSNCTCSGNNGRGLLVASAGVTAPTADWDLTFVNCHVRSMTNDEAAGIQVANLPEDKGAGHVTFNNCTVQDTTGVGIIVSNKSVLGPRIVFNNCIVQDCAQGVAADFLVASLDSPVVLYDSAAGIYSPGGGVEFNNLIIDDRTRDRNPITVSEGSGAALQDIRFNNLKVDNTNWTAMPGETSIFPDVAGHGVTIRYAEPMSYTRNAATFSPTCRHQDVLLSSSFGAQTDWTLPALSTVQEGQVFKFVVSEAFLLVIFPNAADRIAPFTATDGIPIKSSDIGAYVELEKMDSVRWYCKKIAGQWGLSDAAAISGPALASYAAGSVPTTEAKTGQMVYVNNEAGGAVPAFFDGTNWRRVTDRAIVS